MLHLEAESYISAPAKLSEDLEQLGALQFTARASGLFAAADISDTKLGKVSGMDMAWFRDTAHVANALFERGRVKRGQEDDIEKARGAGRAFLQVLANNAELIHDATLHRDAPKLPVRVNADTLENDTGEPRFQNDSTAYAVWLPAKLMLNDLLPHNKDNFKLLESVAGYLQAGEYWQQPDEGHWEEDSQIHASSVGVIVGGLTMVAKLFAKYDYQPSCVELPSLIDKGKSELKQLLGDGETPRHGDYPGRKYDASHLFLATTLTDVLDKAAARVEAAKIEKNLVRDIGVIRYIGDTYFAPGFKALLPPGERTTKAEGRLELRNTLSASTKINKAEAQWTLFDPLLSVYWGRQYEQTHDRAARFKQLLHLNRSLSHYVEVENGGLRVPELFHQETNQSAWTPNEHIPLLWSQANMVLALNQFERTG